MFRVEGVPRGLRVVVDVSGSRVRGYTMWTRVEVYVSGLRGLGVRAVVRALVQGLNLRQCIKKRVCHRL